MSFLASYWGYVYTVRDNGKEWKLQYHDLPKDNIEVMSERPLEYQDGLRSCANSFLHRLRFRGFRTQGLGFSGLRIRDLEQFVRILNRSGYKL